MGTDSVCLVVPSLALLWLSLMPFTQPPHEIAWQQKPASYFVCTQDLATPAETQRRRIRPGAHQVEFDAGHHPFLSRPDAFAQLLLDEINASTTTIT